MRNPGMTLHKLPLLVWVIMFYHCFLLVALPIITESVTYGAWDHGWMGTFCHPLIAALFYFPEILSITILPIVIISYLAAKYYPGNRLISNTVIFGYISTIAISTLITNPAFFVSKGAIIMITFFIMVYCYLKWNNRYKFFIVCGILLSIGATCVLLIPVTLTLVQLVLQAAIAVLNVMIAFTQDNSITSWQNSSIVTDLVAAA